MKLKDIRNISVDDKVLIDGIEHVCIMASGFAYSQNVNFRFTNMALPKKIRHTVYNEFYYPCELLEGDIKSGKILFSVIGKIKESFQLKLF